MSEDEFPLFGEEHERQEMEKQNSLNSIEMIIEQLKSELSTLQKENERLKEQKGIKIDGAIMEIELMMMYRDELPCQGELREILTSLLEPKETTKFKTDAELWKHLLNGGKIDVKEFKNNPYYLKDNKITSCVNNGSQYYLSVFHYTSSPHIPKEDK